MATDRRIAQAAGLIAAFTLLSRILGFVRESLAGRLFTRLQTDAYFAAFAVPDFMYYLLVGGALSAAFIPVFTEYLAKGEEKQGWRAASTFMNSVVVLLILFAGIGMIFNRDVARLEAPGFRRSETVQFEASSTRLAEIAALGYGVSQSTATREIAAGRFSLNGEIVRNPRRLLRPGDRVALKDQGRFIMAKAERLSEGRVRLDLKRVGIKLALVAILTRIMFSSVAMLALAGLLSGVLYSYQSFFTPALGPVLYNIGIIGGAALLGIGFGIRGMAFGVVAGAAASLILQAWAVRRRNPMYSPFLFDFRHPGFTRMLWLLLPALFGLSATQLNILFTNMMASGLPESSISALRFSNRLIQLPLGIFAAAIATAFFPAMARAVAEKKMEVYKETFSLGLRAILFVTIPAAVGLVVLRVPIITLLFQGQHFSARDTQLTAYALAFYSIGLFAHAAILMLPRAFYSLQDTKTPLIVTASTVAISLLLNLIFLRFTNLRHGGLALSFSIMGLLNMVSLLYLLRRKVGRIGGRSIVRTFALSVLASLAMGLATYVVNRAAQGLPFLAGRSPVVMAGVQVLAGMGAGIVLYAVIAYLLKMEEMHLILGLIKRRVSRVRTAPEGPS